MAALVESLHIGWMHDRMNFKTKTVISFIVMNYPGIFCEFFSPLALKISLWSRFRIIALFLDYIWLLKFYVAIVIIVIGPAFKNLNISIPFTMQITISVKKINKNNDIKFCTGFLWFVASATLPWLFATTDQQIAEVSV